MAEITIEALTENLPQVLEFIDTELEKCGCQVKAMMQLDIAVEELFVNIASYAYGSETGDATVIIDTYDNPASVVITFKDKGKQYNPLEKEDPDITLSAEDRAIGGLGVFMVKKSMDNMEYEYSEGYNILKITKLI